MVAATRRASRAFVLALCCASPLLAHAAAAEIASPPEPDVGAAEPVSARDLESVLPGDPRRPALLRALAARSHADAVRAESEERAIAGAAAAARGQAVQEQAVQGQAVQGQVVAVQDPAAAAEPAPGGRAAAPPRATPRADALRGRTVEFAQRLMDEAPAYAEAPDALVVGGIDAERIGRARDGMRMLGFLIRRFPESRHIADAWLALGEHHLRTGDLTRAQVAYTQAEQRGRPAVRAWAAARLAETSLAAADVAGAVSAIDRALQAGAARAPVVLERMAAEARRLGATRGELRKLSALLDRVGDGARARAVLAEAEAQPEQPQQRGGGAERRDGASRGPKRR